MVLEIPLLGGITPKFSFLKLPLAGEKTLVSSGEFIACHYYKIS
jgi:hypothetical protein